MYVISYTCERMLVTEGKFAFKLSCSELASSLIDAELLQSAVMIL